MLVGRKRMKKKRGKKKILSFPLFICSLGKQNFLKKNAVATENMLLVMGLHTVPYIYLFLKRGAHYVND